MPDEFLQGSGPRAAPAPHSLTHGCPTASSIRVPLHCDVLDFGPARGRSENGSEFAGAPRGGLIIYLIYDQAGKRALRLQGQLASGGGPLSAELTPAR